MTIFKFSPMSNGRIRFNVLGKRGFIAVRKYKSRGWGLEKQNTFTQLHLGRRSIAFDVRGRHTGNNFQG